MSDIEGRLGVENIPDLTIKRLKVAMVRKSIYDKPRKRII